MATFKAIVLPHHKRADGTFNIKVRLTHNRTVRYLPTTWYVGPADLTRSLKIKNQKYLDMAEDLIRSYREVCDSVGTGLAAMSADEVASLVRRPVYERGRFRLEMLSYMRAVIDRMRCDGRMGTANAYEAAYRSLRSFAPAGVDVNDISVKFLRDWIEFVRRNARAGSSTNGERASEEYVVRLRAVFNMAKREFNDEEAGVVCIPLSPFNRLEGFRRGRLTRKRALTVEQLRRIAALSHIGKRTTGRAEFNLALDCFLLSFMLVGMNPADLYDCRVFGDGVIRYWRVKTRSRREDGAEMCVRVEPEARELFERYRDATGERVFDFHRRYRTAKSFYNALQRGMKLLGRAVEMEGLQFYAARHTWATLAANKAGIDKYLVHEALNHVVESMRVTEVYIERDWEPVFRANRAVLDFAALSIR